MAVLDRIAMPGTPQQSMLQGFGAGRDLIKQLMDNRARQQQMEQSKDLLGLRKQEMQQRQSLAQQNADIARQRLGSDKQKQNLELMKFLQSNPDERFRKLMEASQGYKKSALEQGQSFIPSIGEGEKDIPETTDWQNPELMYRAQSLGFKPEQLFKKGKESLGIPTGEVANELRLQKAKEQYGEDSPEVRALQEAIDLGKENKRSQIDTRNIYAQTAPTRVLSAEGKKIKEYQDTLASTDMSPEQKRLATSYYERMLDKGASDTDARKRARYASVMEKTIENLNLDHLVKGSGLSNATNMLQLKTEAALGGKPAQELKDYSNAVTTANLLAKQIRQFYGDSITPSATNAIKKLANPNHILKNPEVTKSQLQQLLQILQQESQIMKDEATPFTKSKLEYNPDENEFGIAQSGSKKSTTPYKTGTSGTKSPKIRRYNPETGRLEDAS